MTCGGVAYQWLHVPTDHFGGHNQGVAAGEKNISDIGMPGYVSLKSVFVVGFELLLGTDSSELCPPEAV